MRLLGMCSSVWNCCRQSQMFYLFSHISFQLRGWLIKLNCLNKILMAYEPISNDYICMYTCATIKYKQ